MKKLYFFFALILLGTVANSQEIYSRVKIYCTNAQLIEIGKLGIPVDHGKRKFDYSLETELSESQLEILSANGYLYDVLIADVKAHVMALNANPPVQFKGAGCGTGGSSSQFNPQTPENFNPGGSYGGYFKYQEMLDNLDSMASKYPSLITARAQVGSYLTHEGREIWWVRISDNPNTDEAESEILYSAIHHAREPMSMSETIFYMWWLLENYGTDDEVTYLVDNTEMYFIPCLNPDGYIHNQNIEPTGGGMHRKNKNPAVGTTNPGVDLNRNYSYHWDETGTSPDENNDTYAGSGAFSEPETQAMKWFCEQRDFEFAFNAHSHGDLLLFPIGWTEGEFAADHDYFLQFTDHMVTFNNYANQKATDLYPASGDSDDWMYIDDLATKPKIFAMTPEIGDAFWPPAAAVDATCKEMLFPNKTLAHMPLVYGVIHDTEPTQVEVMSGYFNYNLERLGLTDGDMTVSATALAGIQTIGGPNTHTLTLGEIQSDSVSFTLDPAIAFGDEIKYVLHTNNGLWTRNDTITKAYGALSSIFLDECSDISNWTPTGDWDYTTEDFVSSPGCITDSPYDPTYSNWQDSDIELNTVFDFSGSSYAYAKFWAKWEIENDYDYVEFMASADGGSSWTPLCGKYTNSGTSDQDDGEPLYDGFQTDWVYEEVDLSDYVGMSNVKFKFRIVADVWTSEDGFYFDDFEIFSDDAGSTGVGQYADLGLSVYPNPASTFLYVELQDVDLVQQLEVYNETGELVLQMTPSEVKNIIHTSQWAEGIYFIKALTKNQNILTDRFTIIR